MNNRRSVTSFCVFCCVLMIPIVAQGHHPNTGRPDAKTPAQEQAKQLVEKGMGYISQKAFGDAAMAFQRATQLDPEYADAYFSWGVVLGAMEQRQEEIEKYEQAVHYNPKHAEAYVAWGLTLWQLGRPAEARTKLMEALAIDPFVISPAQKTLLRALGLSE